MKPDIRVVWSVWSVIPALDRQFESGTVFSSYEEQAAVDVARELNGRRLVPQFYVERDLVVAGRTQAVPRPCSVTVTWKSRRSSAG